MATKLTEPIRIDGVELLPIPTNRDSYKGLMGYRCAVCKKILQVWFQWIRVRDKVKIGSLIVPPDDENNVDWVEGAVIKGRDLYLCLYCLETLTDNMHEGDRAEDLLTLMLLRGW